jgi:hypothetical protein
MAGAHDHPAGRVPFWIHQLVELLLGILLLVQGARTGEHTAVLVTLGTLLLLLALCSDGALAAWPWIGRRLHRVLDVVAAAVLALSPLVLGLDHLFAIVILEVAAAAMLWLALRTEWRTRAERKPAAPAAPTPPPPTSPTPPTAPTPSTAPAPPVAPAPATSARPAGPATPEVPLARKLGSAVGKARDDGPRQLGRLVGRAQRAAKAAMAPDPPAPAAPEPPGGPSDAPEPPEPAPPT